MAYHDDLIEHAIFLPELNMADEPKQVDLRQVFSAAYYGIFHLLTSDAALNWKHPGQRDRFARLFEHGRMKTCAARVASHPLPYTIAEASIAAEDARAAWLRILETESAPDFLLDLMGTRQ